MIFFRNLFLTTLANYYAIKLVNSMRLKRTNWKELDKKFSTLTTLRKQPTSHRRKCVSVTVYCKKHEKY